MNKRIIRRAILGLGLLLSMPISAQADDALTRVKASHTLKVGTETAFRPDLAQAGGRDASAADAAVAAIRTALAA